MKNKSPIEDVSQRFEKSLKLARANLHEDLKKFEGRSFAVKSAWISAILGGIGAIFFAFRRARSHRVENSSVKDENKKAA